MARPTPATEGRARAIHGGRSAHSRAYAQRIAGIKRRCIVTIALVKAELKAADAGPPIRQVRPAAEPAQRSTRRTLMTFDFTAPKVAAPRHLMGDRARPPIHRDPPSNPQRRRLPGCHPGKHLPVLVLLH